MPSRKCVLILLLAILAGCGSSDSKVATRTLVPVDASRLKMGTYKDTTRFNYDQVKIGMRFEDAANLLGPAFEVANPSHQMESASSRKSNGSNNGLRDFASLRFKPMKSLQKSKRIWNKQLWESRIARVTLWVHRPDANKPDKE
jgi:esterase/lipase superfamily enzyme